MSTSMINTKPARGMRLAEREYFFSCLSKAMPEPETELRYTSDFELLVAVVLSAQATDKGVNKATAALFPVANTPEAMAALGEEGLLPYLSTLNYYRTKTKNLIQLSQTLVAHYGSKVPSTREALESLPGVGRKTANVVLNVAFGQPTMAVDTHIFRVSNRTGLAPGATVRAVEDALLKRIPKPYLHHAHHWLVLHGRYVCQARRPRCGSCQVYEVCHFAEKGTYAEDKNKGE
jgi:endonuclease III